MPENSIGLIPAAGKGLRLGLPYPKELYPIIRNNRYKPVVQYVVENLTSVNLDHIVFVINETKHQLIGYFGDGSRFNCNFSYVVQEQRERKDQSTSPGLAHALNASYHLVKGKTVYFGMADTIMTPKTVFQYMIDNASEDDDVILGLYYTNRPEKFGMVEYNNENRVLNIIDKPEKTNLKYMWGCIVWRPRFTEHLNRCISHQGLYDFAAIMNSAIESDMNFRGVIIEGSFVDLGTYEEILDLDKLNKASS